ncbi:EamA family transporter [Chengkuizengella sediminis]|uniref:EamA family transporter n=1 Tax=Chengkuizengella sediminis TaxID=1885917 RepID=UPI00138985A0|nr:EamA family transporter [Chengkuizengella sediminis]
MLPVSKATTFLYLVPVMAILIGWLWLQEVPTFLSIVGGTFVILGVVIVNKKMSERKSILDNIEIHS